MAEKFPVIEVPPDAPGQTEEMGTKEKFWFYHPTLGRCLYKKVRQNTGEDWAEKIAAELCKLLCLPHASYELASFQGERGVISPSFIPEGGILTPGNEILAPLLPNYPLDTRDISQHTIDNVLNAIASSCVNLPNNWIPPKGINNATDVFVGYLLLDAWIGNTDRHHENWAFVTLTDQTYLSPTYDHASCLGRNESDEKMKTRLTTSDRSFSVEAYTQKSKSAFYSQTGDKKTLQTLDVFTLVASRCPDAAKVWLDILERLSFADIREVLKSLPNERISVTATQFVEKILELNRDKLVNL